MENLRKMLMAMAKDIRVILIKICRPAAQHAHHGVPDRRDKQQEKSLETMEIYAPIAHRLGMQQLKWELEDLSLKYLDPVGYEEIERRAGRRLRRARGVSWPTSRSSIEAAPDAGGHPVHRLRPGEAHLLHLPEDVRPEQDPGRDLRPVRLPGHRGRHPGLLQRAGLHPRHVSSRCWAGSRTISAPPSPTCYQSLHTTVIGREGIPFEVQIRTWEMHQTAEYGVAAHWKYKQGMANEELGSEETFEWIRQPAGEPAGRRRRGLRPHPEGGHVRRRGVCLYPPGRRDEPARRGHPHRLCLLHPLRRRQPHGGGPGQRPHRPL